MTFGTSDSAAASQAIGADGAGAILNGDSAVVSDQAPDADMRILSKEEKIEYRDQDGNLLDPEQVKSLEGKVEFRTRYETKTRLVDEYGAEIGMQSGAGVAPPHPDVQGVDKETVHAEGGAGQMAQDASSSKHGAKEAEWSQARPASEGREATGHEEL